MNDTRSCPSCGGPLPGNRLPGLCPACAWKGLSDLEPEADPTETAINAPGVRMRFCGHEVVEEIARGGMGIVYRARQTNPHRTVALKMLLPHQQGSAEMAERFRLEVRALTELEHPAILPVYQVGEHNGLPFFTMKLAAGGTLAQRKNSFAGNWRAIAELMATVAEAVHFAHERGVLHRDLKPGNILFDDQGRPYVSDFGLAKIVAADLDLTQSVDFLGTPHYVAPEVAAQSARQATTASDLYSLGAILYELLRGRPPFEADSVVALLKKIAEEEPKPPLTVKSKIRKPKANRAVPGVGAKNPSANFEFRIGDLGTICLKCLAKEPARRYGSARELAEDLRRWLEGREILARPAGPAERAMLWARRHRGTAAALGLAVLLLLALVSGLSISAWRIAASRRDALRAIEGLEAQKANGLLADGSTAEAIALLARRVRHDPKNWADCARLMSALQCRRWAVPLLEPFRPPGLLTAELCANATLLKGSDQCLLALFVGTNLVVRDVEHGTNRHEWPLPFVPKRCRFMDAGKVELTDAEQRVWTFDAFGGRMLEQAVIPQSNIGTSNLVSVNCGQRMLVIAPDHSVIIQDRLSGQSKTLVTAPLASPVPGWQREPSRHPFNGGRKIIFSDGERVVRVVDCDTGELVGPAFTASDRVESILVSPDDRVAVILNSDGSQFWDLEAGRELPGPRDAGVHLTVGEFRPGGSQYIVAGNPFGLVLFEPLTGHTSKLPSRGDLVEGFCSPVEEGRFAVVTFQRCVAVFDAATGQPLCEPLGHIDAYINAALKFVHDRFATRDAEGLTVLWGVKTNRAEPIVLRHRDSVVSAHFSSDGQRVVTASHDGTAQVWDARSGQRCGAPLEHSKKVWSACFSPDGRRVATASWDASARLWDATSGAPLSPPLQAGSYVFHVEFSPDGDRLVACGEDGVVRLYDGHTGQAVHELPKQRPVYWAHFSPDGRTIVARPFNENPVLWDVQTGHKLHELTEPPGRRAVNGIITRGDFSRDGEWLALGSPENYATIWHLPEGRLHAVLNQAAVVRTALFSPDAHMVLTVDDDVTARLWDAQTGKPVATPLVSQHRPGARLESGQALRGAAIHPDGRRAATGGSDAAVRMWDLRNGLSLGEPVDFGGAIMHAEFSPDGQRLLVACFDGTAHILPLPPVVERAPDWLAPLAEALVFQRFDAQGATEFVSPVALWELCEALRRAPRDDPAVRWARELLDL